MRMGQAALAAALLLAAGAASAGSRAAPDPGELVKARQAGMRLSGAVMAGIKGAIDRGDDVKTQTFAARSLAGWAGAAPGLFPEGSNVAPTNALPSVWSDRAGFEARAAAYAAAATRLAELATAGDKPGFAAQWTEVRATCGGCHDTYKQP